VKFGTMLVALLLLMVLACSGGGVQPYPPLPVEHYWIAKTTGELAQARDMHTATLLLDGKVLVVGGETQGIEFPNGVAAAELYDPATQTWLPAGNLVNRRLRHSAVLLPNGKVIVLGGWDYVNGRGVTGLLAVEEWDPATKSFRVIGSLLQERAGGQAFLRQDGKIQVVGGFDSNSPITSETFRTEIFDPVSGTSQPDFYLYELEINASLVPIDSSHFVLLGGENGFGSWHQLDSAYLYGTDGSQPNPSVGGTMPSAFSRNSAVNVPSGKVVAGGGFNQFRGIGDTISIIDYAHLGSGISSVKMSKPRMGHQTMIFPDGTVGFVAGETFTGYAPTSYLSDIEVLDLLTMKTSLLPAKLRVPRTCHTLTPLGDGSFLIVGGYNYQPGSGYGQVSLNTCERLVYQ